MFFPPGLQSAISAVTAAYNREQLWLANESLITRLQACCRGYLVRQEFSSRMHFLKKQVPAITCIQVSGALEGLPPQQDPAGMTKGPWASVLEQSAVWFGQSPFCMGWGGVSGP